MNLYTKSNAKEGIAGKRGGVGIQTEPMTKFSIRHKEGRGEGKYGK